VLQFINELVVQAAVELGLEDGKQLRVDTTVVQTDIHHPTDSALLGDAVRVITRLVQRLGEIIPHGVSTFHHRTRAAKRRHQQIQRMTSSQRQTRLTGKYRELIVITEEVVQSARAYWRRPKRHASGVCSTRPCCGNSARRLRTIANWENASSIRPAAACCKGSKFPTRRNCFLSSNPTPT
jgi:hypothetical protein